MQNHYYDNTHSLRPYTHSLPATPGTIPPTNALRDDAPPVSPAGFWPGEQGGKWVDIEDHRGEEGYLNGNIHTISDFGPYPKGWETTPPEPSEAEKKEIRLHEVSRRLKEIDSESIRPLRAILDGTQTEADMAKLSELENEAEMLRKKLRS